MSPGPDMLIQSLVDSGILSADDATQLTRFEHDSDGASDAAAKPETSAELLEKLKELSKLTPYQINALERGGPQSLLIGDYVLMDRLGAGGMGEVFRAMHRVMRREVAIKRLKTGGVDVPGLSARFMREVRTAAKLSHPNIVTAYDAGEDETGCYLVMEHVEGQDLAQLIHAGGPLPVDRAANYLVQAARALGYAHRAGIIHRDVKPANFLVDRGGTLKLLDLGVARVEQTLAEAEHTQEMTLTQADQLVGTLAYMAPEQAEDARQASVASDLYALGCTFFHMLSGRPPFKANTATKALIAHREHAAPSLKETLPEPLNDLYLRLMAKDPADRPASADEVIREVEAIVDQGALPAWVKGQPDTEAQTLLDADAVPTARPRSASSQQRSTKRPARQGAAEQAGTKKKWAIGAAVAVGIVMVAVLITVLIPPKDGGEESDNGAQADKGGQTPQANTPTDAGSTGSDGAQGTDPPKSDLPMILGSTSVARSLQKSQAEQNGVGVAYTNSVGMNLRYIPSARFRYGSTDEQVEWALKRIQAVGLFDRYGQYIESERPQQVSTIANPFFIGSTEVTVGQFRQFVEATGYKTLAETDGIGGIHFGTGVAARDINWDNPGMQQDDSHPVINITQADAVAFCAWLTKTEGHTYRLPTDLEWEYACRGGSPGRWCYGDDLSAFLEYGWSYQNARSGSMPVAKLRPNAFGLYDMHGNAREWVLLNDGTTADKFGTGIVRGGSFTKPAVLLRSASRVGFKVKSPYAYHGFRVLREIKTKAPAAP